MQVEEEQEERDWAENELGFTQLGDQCLTSRLVTQALPQWHDLKAAYRFFDNAKAVPEHILAGYIVRPGRASAPCRLCWRRRTPPASTGNIIRPRRDWADCRMRAAV